MQASLHQSSDESRHRAADESRQHTADKIEIRAKRIAATRSLAEMRTLGREVRHLALDGRFDVPSHRRTNRCNTRQTTAQTPNATDVVADNRPSRS